MIEGDVPYQGGAGDNDPLNPSDDPSDTDALPGLCAHGGARPEPERGPYMNRHETGRDNCAHDQSIQNQPAMHDEGFPFPTAKAAALRVMTAEPLRGVVFLEGGLVPWMASGCDSGRPHGDVDFSVRLADTPAVREWLAREGLYDRALDSLDLPCNAPRADFGVHAVIDGVPVSFCPFLFDDGDLIQRNAALARFEGFDALFEARIPGIAEEDFVEMREVGGVGAVGFSTLEACRAAKGASGRPKDERVEAAFSGMSVECAAFSDPSAEAAGGDGTGAGGGDEASHWVAGVLAAARELRQEESALLFRSCASACIVGRGVLGHFESARDAAGGDIDAFFELLGSAPGVSAEVVEPGRIWAMGYSSCTCPLVAMGLTRDPSLCECSRQSVAFVLGRLFPEGRFDVRAGGTILAGGRSCDFLISRV